MAWRQVREPRPRYVPARRYGASRGGWAGPERAHWANPNGSWAAPPTQQAPPQTHGGWQIPEDVDTGGAMPAPLPGRALAPDVMGGFPGLPGPIDWRSRIHAMAGALNPSDTLHRISSSTGFDTDTGKNGPAENAFTRLQAVDSAHRAAANLAKLLGNRKPSAMRAFGGRSIGGRY